MSCMAKQTDGSRSHDNLFHSVLGLMDVATKVYDPHLDVFAACRRQTDKVASVQ